MNKWSQLISQLKKLHKCFLKISAVLLHAESFHTSFQDMKNVIKGSK